MESAARHGTLHLVTEKKTKGAIKTDANILEKEKKPVGVGIQTILIMRKSVPDQHIVTFTTK